MRSVGSEASPKRRRFWRVCGGADSSRSAAIRLSEEPCVAGSSRALGTDPVRADRSRGCETPSPLVGSGRGRGHVGDYVAWTAAGTSLVVVLSAVACVAGPRSLTLADLV